nr:unnamed protein product [Callosobruchus analis]
MARELLKTQKILGLPEKKCPSYSPTRWWSILNLMETCVEQHLCFTSLASDIPKLKNNVLMQNDVDKLKATISFMKPLAAISDHMASEITVTASTIIPIIKQIISTSESADRTKGVDIKESGAHNDLKSQSQSTEYLFTADFSNQCYEILKDAFKTRYLCEKSTKTRDIFTMNLLSKTAFLDPRFKDHQDAMKSSKHFRIQTGPFFKLEAPSTKLQENRINTDVEGQQEAISKTLLENQVSDVYAGRLKHFVTVWNQITNNRKVLQWVQGVVIPFKDKPCQTFRKFAKLNVSEMDLYRKLIDDLWAIGAISECQYEPGEFLSTHFLIKKSNGKARFILNLKELNYFIETPHFKIEDYRSVLKLITQNSFLASIDMKDAYYMVPVHNSSRKYLRCFFDGKRCQFNCVPFGLNIAP